MNSTDMLIKVPMLMILVGVILGYLLVYVVEFFESLLREIRFYIHNKEAQKRITKKYKHKA